MGQIWAAGGGAISCYNCTSSDGYNCTTNEATCSATVNSCITIARDEKQGDEDKERTVYEKKCNSDDRLCNQFYGLTAGTYRLRWNSTCCRADRCNVPEITLLPSSGLPNGLQCRSCFARGSDVCVPSEVVNCTGLQTRCIQFAATAATGFEDLRVAFVGCATRSLCELGAVALFASQRPAVVKTNVCSRAGVAMGGLPLLCLGGLLFWALRS
ncbi:phospholipase A2 inhibitor gamma subunit B-like isoform X1 [Pelodiscus sinensis]|uniref:phospholipase A2 inhibitor gamma subunit B-like isoform X1 n=1 Tax=Pelodiscus sinensis TaxID=13735 RepID=UPI003F6CE55E